MRRCQGKNHRSGQPEGCNKEAENRIALVFKNRSYGTGRMLGQSSQGLVGHRPVIRSSFQTGFSSRDRLNWPSYLSYWFFVLLFAWASCCSSDKITFSQPYGPYLCRMVLPTPVQSTSTSGQCGLCYELGNRHPLVLRLALPEKFF
jgi:hypothetical protein